jgi:hypothetical protein
VPATLVPAPAPEPEKAPEGFLARLFSSKPKDPSKPDGFFDKFKGLFNGGKRKKSKSKKNNSKKNKSKKNKKSRKSKINK